MTGPQHFREAQRVLTMAGDPDKTLAHQAQYAAIAQVHATLAHAAATITASAVAAGNGVPSHIGRDWSAIVDGPPLPKGPDE